jgi:sulfoxide reductase catalytic subunit YedY
MSNNTTFRTIPVRPSEITPEHVYLNRRQFLKALGIVSAGALVAAACATNPQQSERQATVPPDLHASAKTDELGAPLNTYEEITNYNNYYEFTTDKAGVAPLAKDFKSSPWQVQVYGLVNNPQTFGIEDLVKQFPPEERIYRLRCVEAW